MSDRLSYILPKMTGQTAPLTYASWILELETLIGPVVPSDAVTERYPFAKLSYFGIEDGPNTLLGQHWILLKWFHSKFDTILNETNERSRVRLELNWLREIRAVPDNMLNRAKEDAADEHMEAIDDHTNMKKKIRDLLAILRPKRDKRMRQDYRSGIPQFNALSTTVLHTILEDIDANILTIRSLVDKHQPNGHAVFIGLQVSNRVEWQETMHRTPAAQQTIRDYIRFKHTAHVTKRQVDILRFDYALLDKEMALWSRAKAGLLTPCGSLHLEDSSSDSEEGSSDSEEDGIEEDGTEE
ncbi:hypothetical protein CALCODRAFT_510988 [Calocera cornea HHB12733]|uniref:Uncharacterized protein n=1 Tax=Calocera cornea HHB12733 TaxID=1353952 RepID=A0A165E4J2_9BASI|nr:hypothetical protein CALCODRAFT_510988 [Calocera cornea HHB12733]